MQPRLLPTLVAIVMTIAIVKFSQAQSIESLVMPGDLVEGHADLESDCDSCHVRFNREGQQELCLDCHELVADDIASSSGFHGLFGDAKNSLCVSCHSDHEGRNADIVGLVETRFDHDLTDYPLIGGHTEVECGDCHGSGDKYRNAPSDCSSCHSDDDPHRGFMGEQCGDCHEPSDWLVVVFDHESTEYPLLGGHVKAACADCHADQTFQNAETTCFGCHAEDDIHNGRSGQDCANCHSPTSWTESSFVHERDTIFDLRGGHAELICDDCHSEEPFSDDLEVACISCHREDDEHDGHFGEQCDTCHNDRLWTESLFNHQMDTGYTLLGKHETIECEACHVEPIYDVPLNDGCNDCHKPDDPHEGEQGTECGDCHNESSWQDDVFFDHGLTRFPLLGTHVETACIDCHETHMFREAPLACVDCHADEDPHEGRFSADCDTCHNPVDWALWDFDHDRQTDFPLAGAHIDVACNECHRQPLSVMGPAGNRCSDCHMPDDVHDSQFGLDCGRCHSSDSFRDVRSIQ